MKKDLDDKRGWRESLASSAEVRIERLETAYPLMLEDLLEAKRRIERLETPLAAEIADLRHQIREAGTEELHWEEQAHEAVLPIGYGVYRERAAKCRRARLAAERRLKLILD